MPSLADHYQEHRYLPDGEFDLTIKFGEMKTANSGNRGPEFIFTDDEGRSVKRVYWLSDKALPMYAQLAKDTGMSKEEMGKIDFSNDSHHRKLDGRRVRGTIERDRQQGKYAELVKTAPVNPNVPAKGEAPRRESAPSHSAGGGYGHDGYGAQPQSAGGFNPTQPPAGTLPDDDGLPF